MANDFLPALSVQRQMLERRVSDFMTQGFEHWIEAEAAKVQNPGSDAQAKAALAAEIARLNAMSANAYAAARRMRELLDELPQDDDSARQ